MQIVSMPIRQLPKLCNYARLFFFLEPVNLCVIDHAAMCNLIGHFTCFVGILDYNDHSCSNFFSRKTSYFFIEPNNKNILGPVM